MLVRPRASSEPALHAHFLCKSLARLCLRGCCFGATGGADKLPQLRANTTNTGAEVGLMFGTYSGID